MAVYVLIIGLVCVLYVKLPSSFLPARIKVISSPTFSCRVGATKERTDAVLRQVEDYFLKQPEIESFITSLVLASMDAGKMRRCRSGGSKIGANAKVPSTPSKR